jgi:hypothetical protein
MNRRQPSRRTKAPPESARPHRRWTIYATVVVMGAVLLWVFLPRSPAPPGAKAPDTNPLSASNAPSAQPAIASERQRLVGRWIRPDGGYVLEIKGLAGEAQIEASYYNPNPIHVSRAEVSDLGSTTKVFVELNDINYPGSTYTLTYDARQDQLAGVYFQAALQQTFDVVFVRAQ